MYPSGQNNLCLSCAPEDLGPIPVDPGNANTEQTLITHESNIGWEMEFNSDGTPINFKFRGRYVAPENCENFIKALGLMDVLRYVFRATMENISASKR